jgi:hypothetical protein
VSHAFVTGPRDENGWRWSPRQLLPPPHTLNWISRRPATTHGPGKRQKFLAFARSRGKISMILAVPGRHALTRLSTGVTITAVEERNALCISAVRELCLVLYLPLTGYFSLENRPFCVCMPSRSSSFHFSSPSKSCHTLLTS